MLKVSVTGVLRIWWLTIAVIRVAKSGLQEENNSGLVPWILDHPYLVAI